jgi:ribosomal protein L34E
MRIEYIKASGVPIVYHYTWSQIKGKPKCLNCGKVLNSVTIRHNNNDKKIGYFCKRCETVHIYSKYNKIISIKVIKNKRVGVAD